MEAIILAGGFGKRLQKIVGAIPKPMAPVNNRPFLDYLLDYLIINKVKSTGMEIYDISTDEGNLEDVFIDLTKS